MNITLCHSDESSEARSSRMIDITRLGADRWADYRRLRLQALQLEPTAFGSSHDEESSLPEHEWRRRIANALFAVNGGTPIGMIAVVQEPRRKVRHIAGIYGVYVDAAYRRQGVGDRLLAAALSAIQRLPDVLKVKLTVNPAQKAAVRLYARHRSETVGRLRRELHVDGLFYDELVMERVCSIWATAEVTPQSEGAASVEQSRTCSDTSG